MAKWTKATGEPITTERRVRVVNIETGEEGLVRVSWENRHHNARFYGSVFRPTGRVTEDGGEPTEEIEILDREPTFC